MATPLAGAGVERVVGVETRWSMENRRASEGCHPRLVLPVVLGGDSLACPRQV